MKKNKLGFLLTYGLIIICSIYAFIVQYINDQKPQLILEGEIIECSSYSTKLGSKNAVKYVYYIDSVMYIGQEDRPSSWHLYKGKKIKIECLKDEPKVSTILH